MAAAIGAVWYLGFDILLGFGHSPQIHPGEYGCAWLGSFLAWEILLWVWPRGVRFGLSGAGFVLRYSFTVLTALGITLFFLRARSGAPLAAQWPPVPPDGPASFWASGHSLA